VLRGEGGWRGEGGNLNVRWGGGLEDKWEWGGRIGDEWKIHIEDHGAGQGT